MAPDAVRIFLIFIFIISIIIIIFIFIISGIQYICKAVRWGRGHRRLSGEGRGVEGV